MIVILVCQDNDAQQNAQSKIQGDSVSTLVVVEVEAEDYFLSAICLQRLR